MPLLSLLQDPWEDGAHKIIDSCSEAVVLVSKESQEMLRAFVGDCRGGSRRSAFPVGVLLDFLFARGEKT